MSTIITNQLVHGLSILTTTQVQYIHTVRKTRQTDQPATRRETTRVPVYNYHGTSPSSRTRPHFPSVPSSIHFHPSISIHPACSISPPRLRPLCCCRRRRGARALHMYVQPKKKKKKMQPPPPRPREEEIIQPAGMTGSCRMTS